MQENQQPGQIIVPHAPHDVPNEDAPSAAPATLPTSGPVNTSAPIQPVAAAGLPDPIAQQSIAQAAIANQTVAPIVQSAPVAAHSVDPSTQAAGWQFHQEEDITVAPRSEPLPAEGISWSAAEFIAHEKGIGWYAALALGGAMAAAVIYLLTKDKITTGIVIFALIAFGVFAGRKPRNEQYALSSQGMQVGSKTYAFHDFKTFSIVDEGPTASIVFMPLKRFMPPLTIYVTSDIEEKVVDYLSAYLPFSEHKADAVDSLMRRIRF